MTAWGGVTVSTGSYPERSTVQRDIHRREHCPLQLSARGIAKRGPRKWTIPRSSRGSGIQGDGVAELCETLDVAALEPLDIPPIEVVGAEGALGHLVAQPVVAGHQHRVRHR